MSLELTHYSKFRAYRETNLAHGSIGLVNAVHTLFNTPHHEKLHADVAELTKDRLQPLNAPLPELPAQIKDVLHLRSRSVNIRRLTPPELIHLAGILMQFTDYSSRLSYFARTPYKHIKPIHEAITEGSKGKPASYAEQLCIALEQTNGDIPEALWRLFLTSRHFARWLDSRSIPDLPLLSREEKINNMIEWQQSIAATKLPGKGQAQDAAGDTYYAWTHALAQVIYGALPIVHTTGTQITRRIFENGTTLMHGIVHRVNRQAVINDHSIAAEYGNLIGKLCTRRLISQL